MRERNKFFTKFGDLHTVQSEKIRFLSEKAMIRILDTKIYKPVARYSREVYNRVFQDTTGTRVYKQTVINKVGGLGWGTLCFLNAGLAENKGRNKWNWLLLSIFTGPLATAYIVITDSLKLSEDK